MRQRLSLPNPVFIPCLQWVFISTHLWCLTHIAEKLKIHTQNWISDYYLTPMFDACLSTFSKIRPPFSPDSEPKMETGSRDRHNRAYSCNARPLRQWLPHWTWIYPLKAAVAAMLSLHLPNYPSSSSITALVTKVFLYPLAFDACIAWLMSIVENRELNLR